MDLPKIANKPGITQNALKVIAVVAMTVDHSTWTFFPGFRTDFPVILLHIVGRLTAPIMMFSIVEGYYHTSNIKKYLARLFIFAVISHFAYALLMTPGKLSLAQSGRPFIDRFIPLKTGVFDQTSVIWAFALGLTALIIYKSEDPRLKYWHKMALVWVCLIAAFIADWSTPAAVSILYMGRNRGNFRRQMLWFMLWMAAYAAVYAIFLNVTYGLIQLFVAMVIPILHFYNGERGKWKGMKWFFYAYYPLHLTVLGLVGLWMSSR
ncbi:MAG: conjugal transfer protein TraX [Clostridiales Family XIII bacterium]|jgi:hypothetical protein|nr:conjugal transfer protein TraX [Clostridiales Family XIII bacterium]